MVQGCLPCPRCDRIDRVAKVTWIIAWSTQEGTSSGSSFHGDYFSMSTTSRSVLARQLAFPYKGWEANEALRILVPLLFLLLLGGVAVFAMHTDTSLTSDEQDNLHTAFNLLALSFGIIGS
jgi:hypothetical protein